MQPDTMPFLTEEDWKLIEEGFRYRWNFPNCVGAVDGKHVVIQCPPKSNSLFYNYKGSFSMVLMAVVDHQYKFKFIDFGEYGSNCDTNVFKHSALGEAFVNGKLNIPGPKKLPADDGPAVPHCLIGDEAFPQRKDFMRPYPKPRGNVKFRIPRCEMIYNMRLSRARNVVENAFGILAQRWRIFMRRVCLSEKNIERVVKATVILHNWLCEDRPVESIIEELRRTDVELANTEACMRDLPHLHGYHTSQESMAVRDQFKQYFNNRGALPWQDQYLYKKYGV